MPAIANQYKSRPGTVPVVDDLPCILLLLLPTVLPLTTQGIPISLSLVYIEVAARLGLPMAGVNLPAHFMIRPQVRKRRMYIFE